MSFLGVLGGQCDPSSSVRSRIDSPGGKRFHLAAVKPSLLLLAGAVGAAFLTSCTTLENRRDLYFPQKVNGPYTRMLSTGIPKTQTPTVTTGERAVSGK